MSKKYTIEYVKQYFKDNNCDLLESEYKDCVTKMKYICSCKNISEITFINFKNGQKCRKCSQANQCEWCKSRYRESKQFCSTKCEKQFNNIKKLSL